MEDSQISHTEEEKCSICLDAKTNAVYLPCLHTYCRECITTCVMQRRDIVTLEEYLRLELDNLIPIVCPDCRNTVFRKLNNPLTFPEAKTCSGCQKYITKIVRFACCGFENKDRCLQCETGKDTGTVKCPSCENVWEVSQLPYLTLCLFCSEFKTEREPICACQGHVSNINMQEIVAAIRQQDMFPRNQQQQPEQPTNDTVPKANVADEPGRTQTESRNISSGHLIIAAISLVVVWYLFFYALVETRHDEPKVERQYRMCAGKEIWIANEAGQIKSIQCDNGWVSYANTNQQTRPKQETLNKQKSERKPIATKKKVPVYQKECYPRKVWLITAEGEIHPEKCEDVINGYKWE